MGWTDLRCCDVEPAAAPVRDSFLPDGLRGDAPHGGDLTLRRSDPLGVPHGSPTGNKLSLLQTREVNIYPLKITSEKVGYGRKQNKNRELAIRYINVGCISPPVAPY